MSKYIDEVMQIKQLIYYMRADLRYEMDEEVKKDILSGSSHVLPELQKKFDALRDIERIIISKLED